MGESSTTGGTLYISTGYVFEPEAGMGVGLPSVYAPCITGEPPRVLGGSGGDSRHF